MDASNMEKGAALLARFEGGGFSKLFGDELRELGCYLEAEDHYHAESRTMAV